MTTRTLMSFFLLLLSISVFSQKKLEKMYAAPNPFTESTTIYVQSSIKQTVHFSVNNILGRTVFKEKRELKKGLNKIDFMKKKLKSGVYLYSIQNKKEFISKRLIIK